MIMSIKSDNNTPRLFEVEEYTSLRRKDTKTIQEFVDKFKPKNGFDECYTPLPVFECVYNYVRDLFPQFNNIENLRPFKPNGDFLSEDYSNKIVIDNPPFSILSFIISFYQQHNIKFWLFASTLHIMHYYGRCDIIICNNAITYANGAKIATSFVTNMYGDNRIVLDGVLSEKLNTLQGFRKKILIKNRYPFVLSGARLQKWVTPDKVLTIKKEDTLPIFSRKKQNVFGNGCYIREGVLSPINVDNSELTDEELLYLQWNNFKPTC